MPDLVTTLKRDLTERLKVLERELEGVHELIDEKARIEHALAQPPFADEPPARASRRQSAPARRAPRGVNRQATLAAIAERPGITASGLQDVTSIPKPVLSRLTRSLVERGEIAAEDLPGGQRGYRVVDGSS